MKPKLTGNIAMREEDSIKMKQIANEKQLFMWEVIHLLLETWENCKCQKM